MAWKERCLESSKAGKSATTKLYCYTTEHTLDTMREVSETPSLGKAGYSSIEGIK